MTASHRPTLSWVPISLFSGTDRETTGIFNTWTISDRETTGIFNTWTISERRSTGCTALHCTALHCTALHCTALHCTALHPAAQSTDEGGGGGVKPPAGDRPVPGVSMLCNSLHAAPDMSQCTLWKSLTLRVSCSYVQLFWQAGQIGLK